MRTRFMIQTIIDDRRVITMSASLLAVALAGIDPGIKAAALWPLLLVRLVQIAALLQLKTILLRHVKGFGLVIATDILVYQWLLTWP